MRIGIVIGRIGGIDGVGLETEKWIEVLGRMGHQVRVLTGALEGEVAAPAEVLPELAFDHPAALRAQEDAFLRPVDDGPGEVTLLARLEAEAGRLADGIEGWARRERIDVLLSENANAIPLHLTMGMAVAEVVRRAAIPAVCHDHDFRWERGERYSSPSAGVRRVLDECFPLVCPGVRHGVINSAAARALAERFGVDDALVVPNVMDFDRPPAARDAWNADLAESLGLGAGAVTLFQVTRIVRRKGIETAIELVDRLGDPAVRLILTGTSVDDREEGYTAELRAQVARLGLGEQVLFAGDRFDAARRRGPRGERIYSLWDAYAWARACTYFSRYEGFGNAFVEALVCRVPVFVNSYEPVYPEDIGAKGFRAVTIEGGELTEAAVEEARAVLADPALRAEIAEHNFALGREHFSYQTLEALLGELFAAP